MLSLMDHYSGGWNVLIIAAFELACIGWVYGKLSYHVHIIQGPELSFALHVYEIFAPSIMQNNECWLFYSIAALLPFLRLYINSIWLEYSSHSIYLWQVSSGSEKTLASC